MIRGRSLLARVLLCATLAGTIGAWQEERASKVWIKGTLTYRERAALPLDSVAVVELHKTSGEPRLIATSRQVLSGSQPPIHFMLDAPREELIEGHFYVLHAAIQVSGRTAWATSSRPINFENDVDDLGKLVLVTTPQPLARALRCGSRQATLRAGETAELSVGSRRFVLRQAASGSGVKYESAGTLPTSLWLQGDQARLLVDGQQWEQCSLEPFRARGNEPGWLVELDANLRLTMGETHFEAKAPPVQGSSSVARYEATAGSKQVAVAIFERPCTDSMSGMPFPHAVEVTAFGQSYRGCGGEPLSLLQGVEWVVRDTGGGSPGAWPVTLSFGPDGRVHGQGPCNPYQGGYALTGEGLRFTLGAAAPKGCAPATLQREKEFFDLLQNVQRFEIGTERVLVLHSSDGRKISAQGRQVP